MKKFLGDNLKDFKKALKKLEILVEDIDVDVSDINSSSWIYLLDRIMHEFYLESRLLSTDKLSLKLYDEERAFIEYGLSYKYGGPLKIEDIFKRNIIHVNYNTKPKKFLVPIIWKMGGNLEIEADCYEEAVDIALHSAPLPDNGEYLDDSVEIDKDSVHYGCEIE